MIEQSEIESRKPLGRKNYGHIPHLSGSRVGPGDHKCEPGQERIATVITRNKFDHVIVQEKVDGSNVGVARIDNNVFALTRAGYLAITSPYEQHHLFSEWVSRNTSRFMAVLIEGERLCGEWLLVAHGTRYNLSHEPFVAFDLMTGIIRKPYDDFIRRIGFGDFVFPHVIHRGDALSIERALEFLGEHGFHGAIDQVEGAVWRVETDRLFPSDTTPRIPEVNFLVKYVRPDEEDGKYLPERSGNPPIYNFPPENL